MKTFFPPTRGRAINVVLLSLLALLFTASAFAAPGAHGPNGEHLDGPAPSIGPSDAAPRLEARSETFELVGRLQSGEFSMFINRFETNEPVLNAQVELETGILKAAARFHADLGDYAVDDKAVLAALNTEGPKAMVITIIAGDESDLLEGTLGTASNARTGAQARERGLGHGHGLSAKAWLAVALALLLVLAVLLGRRHSGHQARNAGGAS